MIFRPLVVAMACFVWTADALAESPPWAGQGREASADRDAEHPGKGRGKAKTNQVGGREHRDADARTVPAVQVSVHFNDGDRFAVRDYFGSLAGMGRCPPGLAKKNNGCLPPGQAKKWQRGRALPGSIARYALPGDLLARLRPPPVGHRYVRVAGDILLIAAGTSMVLDAIEDLGRN